MPQDALHDAEPNVGTVLKSTGSWYNVLTSEGLIAARIRGKMRLKQKESTNPVAVGDRVTIERQPDGTAAITEIHPRWSKLSRRAAGRRATIEHVIVANVEAAWCVQSVQAPRLNPGFMDRFIVMAETDNLDVGLIFNKTDLLDDETEAEVAYWTAVYSDLGYPVLHTSTVSSDGLDALRAHAPSETPPARRPATAPPPARRGRDIASCRRAGPATHRRGTPPNRVR